MEKQQIELEIAELSKAIEAKRRLLEGENGIVEERDLVHAAIEEKLGDLLTPPPPPPSTQTQTANTTTSSNNQSGKSTYLDNLDEQSAARVNELLALVFKQGLGKTLASLDEDDPFIVDAFHDALTDKVYEQLKEQNFI